MRVGSVVLLAWVFCLAVHAQDGTGADVVVEAPEVDLRVAFPQEFGRPERDLIGMNPPVAGAASFPRWSARNGACAADVSVVPVDPEADLREDPDVRLSMMARTLIQSASARIASARFHWCHGLPAMTLAMQMTKDGKRMHLRARLILGIDDVVFAQVISVREDQIARAVVERFFSHIERPKLDAPSEYVFATNHAVVRVPAGAQIDRTSDAIAALWNGSGERGVAASFERRDASGRREENLDILALSDALARRARAFGSLELLRGPEIVEETGAAVVVFARKLGSGKRRYDLVSYLPARNGRLLVSAFLVTAAEPVAGMPELESLARRVTVKENR